MRLVDWEKMNELLHDRWMELGAFGSLVWMGILILASIIDGVWLLGLRVFVGTIVCFALTTIVRLLYFKARPKKMKYQSLLGKIDASSFPSAHAMRASMVAVLIETTLGSNWMPVALVFAFIALGVGISRIVTRKHDWVDVSVGLVLGGLIAIGVSWLW